MKIKIIFFFFGKILHFQFEKFSFMYVLFISLAIEKYMMKYKSNCKIFVINFCKLFYKRSITDHIRVYMNYI